MGCSNPATRRSVVVFPQPEGPRMEKNSPEGDVEIDAGHGLDVVEPLGQGHDLDFATGHRASIPPVRRPSSTTGAPDRLNGHSV